MNDEFENHHVKAKHKRARSLYRQKRAKERILMLTKSDWFWGHCSIRAAGHWEWDPDCNDFVYISKPYLKRGRSGTRKLLKAQTNRRYRRGYRLGNVHGKNAFYKRAFDDWNVY